MSRNLSSKRVVHVSREVVAEMVPPAGAHLISISDSEEDQMRIDMSGWDSVSYHHFVDGGYDETIIRDCGYKFERMYQSYILPSKADHIRERIAGIAEASLIVVNCRYGRSRSAAVARYISDIYGHTLDPMPTEANLTVYGLLHKEPQLIRAIEEGRELGPTERDESVGFIARLLTWAGLR